MPGMLAQPRWGWAQSLASAAPCRRPHRRRVAEQYIFGGASLGVRLILNGLVEVLIGAVVVPLGLTF